MAATRDPDEEYTVFICHFCGHPGGAHRIDQWEPRVTHCTLCRDCPGWDDDRAGRGRWSDRMAERARAEMEQADDA